MPLPSFAKRSMTLSEWIMLLGLAAVWGGSFFFNDVAVREVPVFTVVVSRVALAAIILPTVAITWGWRASFMMGGLIAIFGALVFMLFYRAPGGVVPVTRASEGSVKKVVLSRLAMIREPAMKQIMASGISLISVQYGILIFTVLYLHSRLQMEVLQAAALLFVAQGAGVAGRILLAAWSDRCRSRYFPVMGCMVAVIVGLLVLVWLPLHSTLMLSGLMAWLGFFGFGYL